MLPEQNDQHQLQMTFRSAFSCFTFWYEFDQICSWGCNRPNLQIPQCTCPIAHNALVIQNRNVHISVLNHQCIVGYGTGALWDLWDWTNDDLFHWSIHASPGLHVFKWLLPQFTNNWVMSSTPTYRFPIHGFNIDTMGWLYQIPVNAELLCNGKLKWAIVKWLISIIMEHFLGYSFY